MLYSEVSFLEATYFRSNHQRCSIKKVILKNFAIFTRKHLCWSLFLIKLPPGLQLYKKETLTQVFSCEYYETCFEEHLQTAATFTFQNYFLEYLKEADSKFTIFQLSVLFVLIYYIFRVLVFYVLCMRSFQHENKSCKIAY